MPPDRWFRRDELQAAHNVYEFFVTLYRSCTHSSQVESVRRLLGSAGDDRPDSIDDDPAIVQLVEFFEKAREFVWLHEFGATRDKAIHVLDMVLDEADESMHAAACAYAVQLLDPIVGSAMEQDQVLTYPTVPDYDGWTLVYRGHRFFARYRHDADIDAPPPLEHGTFDQVLDLHWCYVVASERPNNFIAWDVVRVPAHVDANLAEQAEVRITLLSWPHTYDKFEVRMQPGERRFRVHPKFGERDIATIADAVMEQAKSGCALIMLPELVASPELRIQIGNDLKANPDQIGLLLPGSAHIQDTEGRWRNRVTALDSAGAELKQLWHDKMTQFEISRSALATFGMPVPAHTEPILEDIEVTPRRVRFFESATLGRFAIVICRDMLEDPFPDLCRRHRPDHIFVLSMTPTVAAFRHGCEALGRDIDAAIYLVNIDGCPNDHATYVYAPFKGQHLTTPRKLDDEHRICARRVTFGQEYTDQVFELPSFV